MMIFGWDGEINTIDTNNENLKSNKMNTLDIAQAITEEDVEKAKLLHFAYKADCFLDGLKDSVTNVCKEKEIPPDIVDTVFALTYARLSEVK